MNNDEDLPLHAAFTNEKALSDADIDALINEHAKAVEQTNADGSLPIHLACAAEESNLYVIQKLTEAYPEALTIQSKMKLPFDPDVLDYADETVSDVDSSASHNFNLFKVKSFRQHAGEEKEEDIEFGFTPLHLAVLNYASPEILEFLVESEIKAVDMKTSKGRRPIDCAKGLVIDEECDDNSSIKIKNAFAAVEIITLNEQSVRQQDKLRETVKVTTDLLTSLGGTEDTLELMNSFSAKNAWCKLKAAVILSNAFKEKSMLGPKTEEDSKKVILPRGFTPPTNGDHKTMDLVVPVGFRRLRWAMLSCKSKFCTESVMQEKKKYSNVNIGPWDKDNDHIGDHYTMEGIEEKQFIGASRNNQYIMPKSMFVGANTAYVNESIIEYNDYCFAYNLITKTPEVPFGDKFEAHCRYVFINCGERKCRVICSVKCVFSKKPLVAWKIKNAMYSATTDSDTLMGEAICEHAGA